MKIGEASKAIIDTCQGETQEILRYQHSAAWQGSSPRPAHGAVDWVEVHAAGPRKGSIHGTIGARRVLTISLHSFSAS